MSTLALPPMEYVTPEVLRVDVHRPATGRYDHDYGLAVAMAMVASLVRRPIADHLLFLGDVGLDGSVGNVLAARVDRLNDAINAFEIETPLTVVCAPDTAAWVNASSTVTVAKAATLADVTSTVWPGVALVPRQ